MDYRRIYDIPEVDPKKPKPESMDLCRNPSDHFWLGLAIRLAKGTDSRSRVPAKVFQPGSSSIRESIG